MFKINNKDTRTMSQNGDTNKNMDILTPFFKFLIPPFHQTFTCSKLTIETLEKGVK